MKSKAFGPLLLSLALLGGLSGCVIWDAGYTENKPVSRYVVPPADKFPITYSVSMSAERDDVFALPEVKGLRKKDRRCFVGYGHVLGSFVWSQGGTGFLSHRLLIPTVWGARRPINGGRVSRRVYALACPYG